MGSAGGGTAATAATAGGAIGAGGTPWGGRRQRDSPNPPLSRSYGETLYAKACQDLGYRPFPTPSAQMSRPYTNPDGLTMGACLYCGFCMNYACEVAAKATPQTALLPAAPNPGNYEGWTFPNAPPTHSKDRPP